MARDNKGRFSPKAEQKSPVGTKRREVQQVVGTARNLADAHAQMLGEQPGVTLAEGATTIEQDALDQRPPPPDEPASPVNYKEICSDPQAPGLSAVPHIRRYEAVTKLLIQS